MNELDYQIRRLNDIADRIGEDAEKISKLAGFTIEDRIEIARTVMCDEYCKWPVVFNGPEDEDRLQLRCAKCPMRLL